MVSFLLIVRSDPIQDRLVSSGQDGAQDRVKKIGHLEPFPSADRFLMCADDGSHFDQFDGNANGLGWGLIGFWGFWGLWRFGRFFGHVKFHHGCCRHN